MRSLAAAAVAILIATAASPIAHAEEPTTEWELPGANLALFVPDALAVVTRDGIQSHPEVFESAGVTEEDLLRAQTEGGAYLDAVAADLSHEILVAAYPLNGEKKLWNLATASETVVQEVEGELLTNFSDAGAEMAAQGLRRVGDLAWLGFAGTAGEQGDHLLVHATVVNSVVTTIVLQSYGAAPSSDLVDMVSSVVGSVRFLSVTEDPDQSTSAAPTGPAAPSAEPTAPAPPDAESAEVDQAAFQVGRSVGTGFFLLAVIGVVWLIMRRVRRPVTPAQSAAPPGPPIEPSGPGAQ